MTATTAEVGRQRRLHSILAVLATAVAGSLLFGASINRSVLRNNNAEVQSRQHRRLASSAESLSQFADPKTVILRSDSPIESASEQSQRNNNCQVVYIMGVEGATHHGFMPIIEALAKHQVDPESGLQYHVDNEPKVLKTGLFGWYGARTRKWGFSKTPDIDNPEFVQRVVKESCPDDGKKHVLIEWASFPSGHEDDPRSYRVRRQHEWLSMTAEEIANNNEAQQQPFNVTAFVQAYSPYVDIKFIVIHRPFLETIASHHKWDEGPEVHSNVIRGFMLILHRFLNAHPVDLLTGSRLWTLVCIEKIMAKNYRNEEDVTVARQNVVSHLSEFLGWPVRECPDCFNMWRESRKDPLKVLGPQNVEMLVDHMKLLEGVWPPTVEEGIAVQQCGI